MNGRVTQMRPPRRKRWHTVGVAAAVTWSLILVVVWLTGSGASAPRAHDSEPPASSAARATDGEALDEVETPAEPPGGSLRSSATAARATGGSGPVPGTAPDDGDVRIATEAKEPESGELVIGEGYLPAPPLAPDSPEGETEAEAMARKTALASGPPPAGEAPRQPVTRALRLLAADARHLREPEPSPKGAPVDPDGNAGAEAGPTQ